MGLTIKEAISIAKTEVVTIAAGTIAAITRTAVTRKTITRKAVTRKAVTRAAAVKTAAITESKRGDFREYSLWFSQCTLSRIKR